MTFDYVINNILCFIIINKKGFSFNHILYVMYFFLIKILSQIFLLLIKWKSFYERLSDKHEKLAGNHVTGATNVMNMPLTPSPENLRQFQGNYPFPSLGYKPQR